MYIYIYIYVYSMRGNSCQVSEAWLLLCCASKLCCYECVCMYAYIYIYIHIHTYMYMYTHVQYVYIYIYIHIHTLQSTVVELIAYRIDISGAHALNHLRSSPCTTSPHGCVTFTPDFPTNIIPTNIAWLKLSGKFPRGLGMPPLKFRIMFVSNPLKPTMLVGGLGVEMTPEGTKLRCATS